MSIVFISVCYFVSIMDNPLGFLFGKTTTTVRVVDEPPPVEIDPFKILTSIVDRVMDNYYLGDVTVHPGDRLLLSMNYAGCLSVQVSQRNKSRKIYSLYH